MAKPLVIVESPAKAKTLVSFSRGPLPRGGERRAHPRSAGIRARDAGRNQGQAVGPHGGGRRRRLQAVLRGSAREEEERRRPEGCIERRLGSAAGHRPRPRRGVHQLAPDRSAQAEGARAARRVPRGDGRGGQGGDRQRPHRERQPGQGTGEPAHPRPALRLHAVAGALEEGADGPQRGTCAERGRAPARRARGSAACVPGRDLLGLRSPAVGRRARVSSHPRAPQRPARRHGQGLRRRDRHAEIGGCAAPGRSGRDGARRSRPPQHAVDRHGRRRAPRDRAARAAVHDVHAHTGGQPQARVLDEPHDADCAAAVPGGRDRPRRDGRPDHVSPDRLHDAQSRRRSRNRRASSRRCSGPSTTPARAGMRPR